MAVEYLGTGNADGTVLGRSASHKVALFGKTPVVQQGAIVDLTDSTTGTASNTLDDTTAGQKDDVASLAAKINAILAALRNVGIIAS